MTSPNITPAPEEIVDPMLDAPLYIASDITPDTLARWKADCKTAESQAKHFEGLDPEHHLGCGYCGSTCPGRPDWSFARTALPALIAAYERVWSFARTALPALIAAYERVVKESDRLQRIISAQAGIAEALTARVAEVEGERTDGQAAGLLALCEIKNLQEENRQLKEERDALRAEQKEMINALRASNIAFTFLQTGKIPGKDSGT